MKRILLLIIICMVANSVEAKPCPKGYNYNTHYKRVKRTKAINRIFNLNNCNHATFRV